MKNNWSTWARAALIRAVRTFAEAALAYIGTGAVVLGDVNWLAALSAGGFGFVTAILLALTGLPEENLSKFYSHPLMRGEDEALTEYGDRR